MADADLEAALQAEPEVKTQQGRSRSAARKPKVAVRGRTLDAVAQRGDRSVRLGHCPLWDSPEESARRFQCRCDQIPTSITHRGGATEITLITAMC